MPSGQEIGIDAKGNVGRAERDEHGKPYLVCEGDVTAKELDAIVAAATIEAKRPPLPEVPECTEAGHDVYVKHEDVKSNVDNDAKPGDVGIGCQLVPFKILIAGHRASLAARRKKARK